MLVDATGVVVMKNFELAVRSPVYNVLLCSLLTLGLAACGADGSGSSSSGSAASASTPTSSLVAPNSGVITRTGIAENATKAGVYTAAVASTTTPTSNATPTSNTRPPSNATPPSNTKSSTGTATLDWTPPTENSDGSVLTDLAGYTVYYGTSPNNLTQSVKIGNPGLTAYTMTNLPAGTWYFAVTSYSTTGAESARSGVISARI
jgi:hypothetical protein